MVVRKIKLLWASIHTQGRVGTGKGEVPMPPKGFGLIAPSDKKRDFSLGQMSTLDRRKTTDVVGTWFFHSYVRRNGKSPTTKVNVG